MRRLLAFAAVGVGIAMACGGSGAFECADDSVCVNESIQGTCEPTGFCSFPDPACASGSRYGQSAGGGLAGECVEPSDETSGPGLTSTGVDPATTTGDLPVGTSSTGPAVDGSSSSGADTTTGTGDSSSGSSSDTGVTADPNFVFVSSGTLSTDAGIAAADTLCNDLAANAGLGGTYVAWMSSSTMDARDRLAGARGWVRVDGRIFADTVNDIVTGLIYHPLILDELGIVYDDHGTLTGTLANGTAALETCNDWTSVDPLDTFLRGSTHRVYPRWTARGDVACGDFAHVYCFGIDAEVPVEPPSDTGRIAFVTGGFVLPTNGVAAFDQQCQAEAMAHGLPGTYLAAVATSTTSVGDRFDLSGDPWVNTVGALSIVDTSDLLVSGALLQSPIHWEADGSLADTDTWTGTEFANTPATLNCVDWTDALGMAVRGDSSSVVQWLDDTTSDCASPRSVVCLQQ